jgi:hypothetical protein
LFSKNDGLLGSLREADIGKGDSEHFQLLILILAK